MRSRRPLTPSCPTQGFTLIELITVIVILGVLAATALPKFMDMQRDARIAKLQGLQGALRSTANQLHALCMLQYTHCSEAYGHNTVMPNQTEAIHVKAFGQKFQIQHGWPAPFDGWAASAGYVSIASALNLDGFYVLPYVGSSFEREFRIPDAPDPSACKVTYRVAIWAPNLTPTYTLTNTGC